MKTHTRNRKKNKNKNAEYISAGGPGKSTVGTKKVYESRERNDDDDE